MWRLKSALSNWNVYEKQNTVQRWTKSGSGLGRSYLSFDFAFLFIVAWVFEWVPAINWFRIVWSISLQGVLVFFAEWNICANKAEQNEILPLKYPLRRDFSDSFLCPKNELRRGASKSNLFLPLSDLSLRLCSFEREKLLGMYTSSFGSSAMTEVFCSFEREKLLGMYTSSFGSSATTEVFCSFECERLLGMCTFSFGSSATTEVFGRVRLRKCRIKVKPAEKDRKRISLWISCRERIRYDNAGRSRIFDNFTVRRSLFFL